MGGKVVETKTIVEQIKAPETSVRITKGADGVVRFDVQVTNQRPARALETAIRIVEELRAKYDIA
jgi:hypothetical protein